MFRLRTIISYVLLAFILFSITATASAAENAHRVQDKVNHLLEQDANGTLGPKTKVAVIWEFANNIDQTGKLKIANDIGKICRAAFSYQDYYVTMNDNRIFRDIYTSLESSNQYQEARAAKNKSHISLTDNMFQIDDHLSREDYASIAYKYGYDYLVILPFYRYNDKKTVDSAGISHWENSKIGLKAKIIDLNSYDQHYIYRRDIIRTGSYNAKKGIYNCMQTFFDELRTQKVMPYINELKKTYYSSLPDSIDDWYGDPDNFFSRTANTNQNNKQKNFYGPTNY